MTAFHINAFCLSGSTLFAPSLHHFLCLSSPRCNPCSTLTGLPVGSRPVKKLIHYVFPEERHLNERQCKIYFWHLTSNPRSLFLVESVTRHKYKSRRTHNEDEEGGVFASQWLGQRTSHHTAWQCCQQLKNQHPHPHLCSLVSLSRPCVSVIGSESEKIFASRLIKKASNLVKES